MAQVQKTKSVSTLDKASVDERETLQELISVMRDAATLENGAEDHQGSMPLPALADDRPHTVPSAPAGRHPIFRKILDAAQHFEDVTEVCAFFLNVGKTIPMSFTPPPLGNATHGRPMLWVPLSKHLRALKVAPTTWVNYALIS